MRLKKNKYIFLISLIVILIAVLEVTARVIGFGDPPLVLFDDKIEYYLKPNADYMRFGNRISVNKYGMRSRDFNKTENFDVKVALFGDSVVYGNHFLDQSEMISSKLEQKLSGLVNAVICFNIAASSWGPINNYEFTKKSSSFSGEHAL